MSKSRNPPEKTVMRWIDQGLGQGSGLNYKPFFYVRDVPSRGRSTILEGLKIPRKHHYLSDIEYHYHLLAEFSDSVTEIREQFALLPREETKFIADQLGIKHPMYSATGVLRVLTSDLVLTVRKENDSALMALCCKAASDIDPQNPASVRTLEKIMLEKIYWESRGAIWRLVTDDMLPENKVSNLDFFRGTMVSRELDYLLPHMRDFVATTLRSWNECCSLNELLAMVSAKLGLECAESFCLLGRAIWCKYLRVDLDERKFSHEGCLPTLPVEESHD